MPQNAIDLLKEDHVKVKDLLEQLVDTTDRAQKKRQELLQKIERELMVHTKIEEEIFYPAFKETNGKEHKEMYYEAMEEHRAVEKLILPDLKKTDPTSAQFAGRAKLLQEMIQHHVKDEEEEMFPEAEKSMSSEELEELGQKMMERKKKLQAQH